jgi:hypothetical protein
MNVPILSIRVTFWFNASQQGKTCNTLLATIMVVTAETRSFVDINNRPGCLSDFIEQLGLYFWL